jgi:hypothetical protein
MSVQIGFYVGVIVRTVVRPVEMQVSNRFVAATLPSLFNMKYIPEQKRLHPFFKASKRDGNKEVETVRPAINNLYF